MCVGKLISINRLFALMVWCLNCGGPALAETFPEKFVKVVIAVSPGGLQDQLARAVCAELSSIWKHPVIVESKLGSGGILATEAVRQSRADGYTILQMDNINVFTNAYLREKKPQYDFEKVMVPVRSIVALNDVLVLNPALGASSVAEFVALAKAAPNKINYGSFGTGTIGHIDMEALASIAGIKLTHVPYKGGNPLVQALIAGEVSVALLGVTSALGPVREGKLKALAYLSDGRAQVLPGVPTLKEAGIPFSGSPVWVAWWVPEGTSAAVIDKISGDIDAALKAESFKKAIEPFGYEILNEPGPIFREHIAAEAAAFKARALPLNIMMGD
jgi:tripartite-type tricarboxylate transporter receptor subunit TctC